MLPIALHENGIFYQCWLSAHIEFDPGIVVFDREYSGVPGCKGRNNSANEKEGVTLARGEYLLDLAEAIVQVADDTEVVGEGPTALGRVPVGPGPFAQGMTGRGRPVVGLLPC